MSFFTKQTNQAVQAQNNRVLVCEGAAGSVFYTNRWGK